MVESISLTRPNISDNEDFEVESLVPAEAILKKRHSKARILPRRSIWLDTWLFEGIALAFSISCFIAVCVILLVYDNKLRPDTLLYELTLNTLVSILATGCKSALVLVVGEAISQLKWLWFHRSTQSNDGRQLFDMQSFDAASRGPLGAFMILIRHRAQSLVSLGAVVMLLLLVFDPFVQQVIKYPTRLSPDSNSVASAPQIAGELTSVTALWDHALSQGFWSDQEFLPPLQCPSGNCTWEGYPSAGFCSRCSDLTPNVTFDCQFPQTKFFEGYCAISLAGTGRAHMFNWTRSNPSSDGGLMCLPTDIVWQPYNIFSTAVDGALDKAFQGQFNSSLLYSSSFLNVKSPLWSNVHAKLGLRDVTASWNASNWDFIHVKSATGCLISPCLREFNVSVTNGNVSSQILRTDWGTIYSVPDEAYIADDPSGKHRACWKPTGPELAEWFGFCNLAMSYTAGKGPRSFSPDFSTSWYKDWIYHGRKTQDPTERWELEDSISFDPAYVRLESTGLQNIMESIAASLTKMGMEGTKQSVNGIANIPRVFVEVQWLWIILPATLVLTGTSFSLATIIVSRKSDVPLWKSSALAPFFHGLEETKTAQYLTASNMEKEAEICSVQLKSSDQIGRLMLHQQPVPQRIDTSH